MTMEIVILAAGQGSRMKSNLPKVLHHLAGRPLLMHAISAANQLKPDAIHVVIGHQSERVRSEIKAQFGQDRFSWVIQENQLGTGDAVRHALPEIALDTTVLIMAGDVPLIQPETLAPLCDLDHGINLLTVELPDPTGFGRIIRDSDSNNVLAIVEHKDASDDQRRIGEINTGIMAAKAGDLRRWIAQLDQNNQQNEYYLTDIIALAVAEGLPVHAFKSDDIIQVTGVNSRAELARLERAYQLRMAEQLMAKGASLADPKRVDIRGQLTTGRDCFIDINAVFEQQVTLGDAVVVGPNVVIRNSEIGDGCHIEANSVIDNARIEANCQVGPFARIRPGTVLENGARIGNFVEIKKSEIGAGSKVNHLSYVGDSTVGSNVNIGAGVITCNYDGAYKHQTIIGNDVFVGSDCQLVAPVRIGDGATIGAGSTITRDAPAHKLSLSRAKQVEIDNYQRPVKTKTRNNDKGS